MNLISSKGGSEMGTLMFNIWWYISWYWRNHWIWSVCIFVLCPIAIWQINQYFTIGVWEVGIISLAAVFVATIVYLIIQLDGTTTAPSLGGSALILLLGFIFSIVLGLIATGVASILDHGVTWSHYWRTGEHISYHIQIWMHLIVMLIVLVLGAILMEGFHSSNFNDDGYQS